LTDIIKRALLSNDTNSSSAEAHFNSRRFPIEIIVPRSYEKINPNTLERFETAYSAIIFSLLIKKTRMRTPALFI